MIISCMFIPEEITRVFCSAGVGRTGSYLAIDYLLQQAVATKTVDINHCVRDLRQQRMHSVQTMVRAFSIINLSSMF